MHVVSLVTKLSLREGLGQEAPACVMKLDPARVACRDRLVPVERVDHFDEAPPSPFTISSAPGTIACNRCHGTGKRRGANLEPVARGQWPELESRRRAILAERLAPRLEAVRQAVSAVAAGARPTG
jgi:hypothetical protein